MQQAQTTQQVFDAVKYKQTTLEQWNKAAEAWDRWGTLLSRWLGPATETMLDMADVNEGARVLDVAAGAGEQTIAAARRACSTGYVLATDFSPSILEYAQRNARLAGLDNVGTHAIDGERLDELDAGPFDAVISRVGLIYFPDQQKALRGMRSPEELRQAATRSEEAGENMSDDIRWIRSYVMEEQSGNLGTVCIYQASSPDARRQHGDTAVLPIDEIIPVMDSVIKRPDPQ
jgi:SAM-dependent methyltransferase